MCENAFDKHDQVIIIGGMNFNMINNNTLSTMLPTYGLPNIIKEATASSLIMPLLEMICLFQNVDNFWEASYLIQGLEISIA